MKTLALQLAVVLVFALALSHFAYQVWGPANSPKYYVTNESAHGAALKGPESDGIRGKFFYLRQTLYLPQQPRYAWLKVVGRDRIAAYVNGQRVGADGPIHAWSAAALVLDISPYLRSGKNVVAIGASQNSQLLPPLVSVDGGYVLDDQEFRLDPLENWRCAHAFSRGKNWWFSVDFDDTQWARPEVVQHELKGEVFVPPRAVTSLRQARWITPPAYRDNTASVRRDFDVDARPQSAWLRLTATTSYRLAVNGVFVDEQSQSLGVTRPSMPVQRTYDITPAIREGHNAVSVQLMTNGEAPHVLADLEVEDQTGHRQSLSSDEHWLARGELSTDWHLTNVADAEAWRPSTVETGDMGLDPLAFPREMVSIVWPDAFVREKLAWEAAIVIAVSLLTWLACWLVARWLASVQGADPAAPASAGGSAYVALVPATVAMLAAMLALYDPRFAPQDVYRAAWVLLALISLPLQWALLAILARRSRGADRPAIHWPRPFRLSYQEWILVLLLICGTWLRVRHIDVEPIHHDEVTAYWFTRGVLENGFPGGQVKKDTPFGFAATSEISFYPTAIVGLMTDDPIYVLRIPTVLFSVATIGLLYFVGLRLFSVWVGLVAAAMYTFSGYCIETSNFGRYFAQLQFLTLLCLYFFYRTIRNREAIDRRALWLCGITFLGVYYSWEGSGFVALGMIAAVLAVRRCHMKAILSSGAVWLAMMVMLIGFFVQDAHRILEQTQRMWYGIGISDLELYPMWLYPNFVPNFYLVQLSWCADSFLPMALMAAAIVLAIRHPWQDPLRVLLITFLATACIMTALLPLRAARYDYHLIPLFILTSAVVLVTMGRAVVRLAGSLRVPQAFRVYSGAVAALMVATIVALGSGVTVQLTEMYDYACLGYRFCDLKFPHWEEPLRYLREHIREGDVVVATYPHVVDHTMLFASYRKDKDVPAGEAKIPKGWSSDYWLQSTLVLQATLDDKRSVPLDRRAGTVMIPRSTRWTTCSPAAAGCGSSSRPEPTTG